MLPESDQVFRQKHTPFLGMALYFGYVYGGISGHKYDLELTPMITKGSAPILEIALLLMAYFWNSKINYVLRPSVPKFVVFVLVEGNGSGIGRKTEAMTLKLFLLLSSFKKHFVMKFALLLSVLKSDQLTATFLSILVTLSEANLL